MTEKDYNPEQKQAKAMKKQSVTNKVVNTPPVKSVEKEIEKKIPEVEKTVEEKKARPLKDKLKKEEAVVRIRDVPISTKHSVAICKFIRHKKLSDAIVDLEQVLKLKKAVPMTGEIPHRKGKGMMSGRFPKKASENFIKILKSLGANALYNGIEEPAIIRAVPNVGVRPYGKFGSVRKKRTHLEIAVREKGKSKIKKDKKMEKKK